MTWSRVAHVAHLRAYGFDNTSGFVAEHDGVRTGIETLLEVHVPLWQTPAAAVRTHLMGARH